MPQTYVFVVTNDGPSKATNVAFKDVLPAGAVFVSGDADQGVVSQSSGVVTGLLGSLASGASTVVDVTYTLPTAGSATNQVAVTADQPDLTTNNDITQTIQVVQAPQVDLALSGFATPYQTQVGDLLTYTFIVTNTGFNNAPGVFFSDPLPRASSS